MQQIPWDAGVSVLTVTKVIDLYVYEGRWEGLGLLSGCHYRYYILYKSGGGVGEGVRANNVVLLTTRLNFTCFLLCVSFKNIYLYFSDLFCDYVVCIFLISQFLSVEFWICWKLSSLCLYRIISVCLSVCHTYIHRQTDRPLSLLSPFLPFFSFHLLFHCKGYVKLCGDFDCTDKTWS